MTRSLRRLGGARRWVHGATAAASTSLVVTALLMLVGTVMFAVAFVTRLAIGADVL